MIPFALVVLISHEGKFLGQTTPWEGVKILFLLSFAGMLADTYRHLRRTRWGLPPARYFFPFGVIAAMPVLPFFELSDFGQMLVFFGVYVMLYVVAVRRKAQLVYAVALVALLFGVFFGASASIDWLRRSGSSLLSILPMGTHLGSAPTRHLVVETRP